jgi:protein-tyrosine phosphatase
MTSILFVCLANICRSPALEATLRHLSVEAGIDKKLKIDSCGLGWYHLGERPDPRTFEAAKERGILIDHQAQQFEDRFFDEFDYILAVDAEIASSLKARAHGKQKDKIHLATDFSKSYRGQPIPDPYYLSQNGFVDVMEMILDSCRGLLSHLQEKTG